MPLARTLPAASLLSILAVAAPAAAADVARATTTTTEKDGTTVETTETVVHDHHHDERDTTWFGLSFGSVATPLMPDGNVQQSRRVTSNPFRACLQPGNERYCSAMRGFDVRVQMYKTGGAWEYPRWVGYFRSGYQAGFARFDPAGADGYVKGEARALAYQSVPLFFGGSVYAFKKFPVRPFAGLGAGFDVLRLRYTRHEDRALLDASARIGFELHAGIEARISNIVAISTEVTQLWSARRKLAGVPDFSNEGLTVMANVAISIPTRKDLRGRHHHVHRRTTVRTERVAPPTKVLVTPAPAPVIVAPAPAPAPVVVAPAPVIVAPAPAPTPVIVAPAPAPEPVIVAPAPAPAPAIVAPAPAPVIVAPAPAPG